MPFVGIDYGARRTGIAVSNSGILATPHSVLTHQGDLEELTARIALIGEATGATLFVLGIPRHARARLERFHLLAALLRQKSCKQVVLWDETLTTVEARERARDRGVGRHEGKSTIDMEAAAIILQSWLDAQGGRPPS